MASFEWVSIDKVPDAVLDTFDCGEYVYNHFLRKQAKTWKDEGYAVTYVAVDSIELNSGNIEHIFAYAAINSTGLLTKESRDKYLSCAEIRMFAVSKVLRGKEAVDIDGVKYSYKIFQTLMQELYNISTSVIGYIAVILNANSTGLPLYKEFGFIEISEYIPPIEEDKLDIEGCTALMFSLKSTDVLERLFL